MRFGEMKVKKAISTSIGTKVDQFLKNVRSAGFLENGIVVGSHIQFEYMKGHESIDYSSIKLVIKYHKGKGIDHYFIRDLKTAVKSVRELE